MLCFIAFQCIWQCLCSVAFQCIWQCFDTTRNSVQNGLNLCNQCTSLCPEVALELFATNAPVSSDRTLNSCFHAFRSVWVHFGSFHYYLKLGAKRSKLVQPDPPHWTLNSSIGLFRTVWCILDLFRYCTKLGAKWVELVQLMKKFVPRTRIRDFRNEHTRSTPLDAKLMNWCVL